MENRYNRTNVNVYNQIEVLREASRSPVQLRALANILEAIQLGGFKQEYFDLFAQSTYGLCVDMYLAYYFAYLHEQIYTGKVKHAKLEMPCEPFPDKKILANNDALQSITNLGPFETQFIGARSAKDGDDGFVLWTEPIAMMALYSSNSTAEAISVAVNPQSVPLEVGIVSISTVVEHIKYHGGLARWPYGSRWLYIFSSRPPTTPGHLTVADQWFM